MALLLEYTNRKEDFLAQYELLSEDTYRSSRSAHNESLVFWSGMMVLASYVAFQSDSIFMMCVFIAAMVWHLSRSIPYSRLYWSAVERSLSARPETRVKLEVRDDGLLEISQGIESFVPWSAVKSFTLFRDTLFMELASNLWAIIPRDSVIPASTAVDEVIRVLRDRGVKESPNQTVQRTGASRFAQSEIRTSSAAGSRR